MVEVYINGLPVPVPGNIKGFEQVLMRDAERRLIYVDCPNKATFAGAGYAALRAAFVGDTCGAAVIEIYDTCAGVRRLVLRGEIILADVEWSVSRCTAEAAIQQSSVGARLLDNFNLRLSPTMVVSKAGAPIAAVSTVSITVPEPQGAGTTTRAMYDWGEAMAHAVRFLTDDTVTITNAWYDALPDDERLALTSGIMWRTSATQNDPVAWSFHDLWLEVARRYNLWAVVSQGVAGHTTITVVSAIDLYAQTTALYDVDHIDGITQKVDEDELYGSVKVGEDDRTKNRQGLTYSALPFIQAFTHTGEEFGVGCLCNRGSALDLACKWVADHGALEHVIWIDGNDNDIDEDVVLVVYDSDTSTVVASDYAMNGTRQYNEPLLNVYVMGRYKNLCAPIVPSSANDSVAALRRGEATPTTGATVAAWSAGGEFDGLSGLMYTVPPLYLYDYAPYGHDLTGSWNFDRFTSSGQGLRSFSVTATLRVDATAGPTDPRKRWGIIVVLSHFTSGGAPLGTYRLASPSFACGTQQQFTSGRTILMSAGDRVVVSVEVHGVVPIDFGPTAGLTYAVTLPNTITPLNSVRVSSSALIASTVDGATPPTIVNEFERHLPAADWVRLLRAPASVIRIGGAGIETSLAWIKEAKRDIVTGKTAYTVNTYTP